MRKMIITAIVLAFMALTAVGEDEEPPYCPIDAIARRVESTRNNPANFDRYFRIVLREQIGQTAAYKASISQYVVTSVTISPVPVRGEAPRILTNRSIEDVQVQSVQRFATPLTIKISGTIKDSRRGIELAAESKEQQDAFFSSGLPIHIHLLGSPEYYYWLILDPETITVDWTI